MENKVLKLKNCPFCNSNNIAVSLRRNPLICEDDFVVECQDCLAQGGSAQSKWQAYLLWNIRKRNIKEK